MHQIRRTRSPSATTEKPRIYTPRSERVTLALWLLLSLAATGCCGGPQERERENPGPVLVDPVDLRSCADVEKALGLPPGALRTNGAQLDCYVASAGFMAKRLEVEQGLEAALLECRER